MISSKVKALCFKWHLQKVKENPQTGRKYLHIMYLKRDLIHKEHLQSNYKKTNKNLNWAKPVECPPTLTLGLTTWRVGQWDISPGLINRDLINAYTLGLVHLVYLFLGPSPMWWEAQATRREPTTNTNCHPCQGVIMAIAASAAN